MGLCQMLTKGHSMQNPKNSSSCVTVEKLLILRDGGIHISSQPCKTPIFSVPAPLLTFFGECCIIIFAIILYWHLDGVLDEKSTEIYNNAPAEN